MLYLYENLRVNVEISITPQPKYSRRRIHYSFPVSGKLFVCIRLSTMTIANVLKVN